MIFDIRVLLGKMEFYVNCTGGSYITKQWTFPELLTFLCQPVRKILTSECHHYLVSTSSDYTQKPLTFRPLYETYSFSFKIIIRNIYHFLFPFPSAIIRMPFVLQVLFHVTHENIYFKTMIWNTGLGIFKTNSAVAGASLISTSVLDITLPVPKSPPTSSRQRLIPSSPLLSITLIGMEPGPSTIYEFYPSLEKSSVFSLAIWSWNEGPWDRGVRQGELRHGDHKQGALRHGDCTWVGLRHEGLRQVALTYSEVRWGTLRWLALCPFLWWCYWLFIAFLHIDSAYWSYCLKSQQWQHPNTWWAMYRWTNTFRFFCGPGNNLLTECHRWKERDFETRISPQHMEKWQRPCTRENIQNNCTEDCTRGNRGHFYM